MGQTPNGLPWPEYADAARIPDDIQALAEATEAAVDAVDTRLTAEKVAKAGDTMTGDLTVQGTLMAGHQPGSPAMASGWTGTISITARSGWVLVKIVGLRKSSAPATGQTMFTVPAGFRPIPAVGTLQEPFAANSSVAGGADGLKTFMASLDAAGACKLAGTTVPAADVPIYGSFTYPYE